MAPVIRGKKGEHVVFENARKQGYVRVRVDGEIHDLSEEFKLAKTKSTTSRSLLTVLSSVRRPRTHYGFGGNRLGAVRRSGDCGCYRREPLTFSQNYACEDCGVSIEELTPRMFSFNNPYGACPVCTGLGIQKALTRPRHSEPPSFHQAGALSMPPAGERRHGQHRGDVLQRARQKVSFTLETPIEEFSEQALDELLYGTGDEPLELSVSRIGRRDAPAVRGHHPNLERRYRETNSEWSRGEIEEVMSESPLSGVPRPPSAPGGRWR